VIRRSEEEEEYDDNKDYDHNLDDHGRDDHDGLEAWPMFSYLYFSICICICICRRAGEAHYRRGFKAGSLLALTIFSRRTL
jgi:hypothetical protein